MVVPSAIRLVANNPSPAIRERSTRRPGFVQPFANKVRSLEGARQGPPAGRDFPAAAARAIAADGVGPRGRNSPLGNMARCYRTRERDVTDEQERVREDSDKLLGALNALKDAEQRKRSQPISTDNVHELADEVEERAAAVWRVAEQERLDGELAPTTGDAIDDVEAAG
jgi:hypothetical protein